MARIDIDRKIGGPVDPRGLRIAYIRNIIDMLKAVLLAPDDLLALETSASARQKPFAARHQRPPFGGQRVEDAACGGNLVWGAAKDDAFADACV